MPRYDQQCPCGWRGEIVARPHENPLCPLCGGHTERRVSVDRREYEKAWRAANPERVKAAQDRYNAKKKARGRTPEEKAKRREWAKRRYRERKAEEPDFVRRQREYAYSFKIARKYGISLDRYLEMLSAQDGRCAICGRSKEEIRAKIKFVVDHCHTTGSVRGILCNDCNVGIGRLGDDRARLVAALEYLERASAQPKVSNLRLVG